MMSGEVRMMLRILIKKEIQGNLTSLRFILTFLLVISVFIASGVTFVGKYQENLADYVDIANQNLAGFQKQSPNLNLVPYYLQTIRKKPLAAQLFVEGAEKDLPNTFRADVFTIQYPEVESRTNFLFPAFADIDWAFIIAIIMSFVAVIMTFDALSGEKQRGTLGLMMSNAVSRDSVLIGKYISGLLTLILPLFAGFLLNMIIVGFGGVPLSGQSFELKILAFLIMAVVYLSVFVLLGLLVSSLLSRSSSSIIAILFIWVILTVLVPAFGRIAAEKSVQIPTRTDMNRQFEILRMEMLMNSERYGKNAGNWGPGLRPEELNLPARAALMNAVTDAKNRIKEDYMNKILTQINKGRAITRFSPTALFQHASEAVMGTGITRFRNLYQQIKRYQEILKDFIMTEDRKDPISPHLLAENITHRRMLSALPVDYNSIPKFEEKSVPLGAGLKNTLWNFALLIIFNIFLGMGVYIAFLRADIRQK